MEDRDRRCERARDDGEMFHVKQWVEVEYRENPYSAVKQILASHATGQLVLNVAQGTLVSVKWRERVEKHSDEGISLTTQTVSP